MAQILYNADYRKELPYTPEELIEKAVREDHLDSIVIVIPTGKLVRRLKQFAIRQYFNVHHNPVTDPHFFTLSKFVEYCYDKIFADRHKYEISDAYRLALLEEASEKAYLKFFSQNKKKLSPVILERLANVIFGLKDDGLTVSDLEKDLVKKDSDEFHFFDSSRLDDVIKLYQKYNELLEDKYLDFPEVLKRISGYIAKEEESRKQKGEGKKEKGEGRKEKGEGKNAEDIFCNKILSGKKIVLFYGFSEFKKPEVDFISLFSKAKIPFALNIDYSTNNGPLFGNLVDSINALTDNGLKISSPDDTLEKFNINGIAPANSHSQASEYPRETFIRRWLFNTDTDIRNNAFSGIIKVVEAENRISEVRYIAKLVKYRILKESINPFDICICMRQPEIYSGLFRESFSSYKIPVNISDRFNLSSSPVVISIFSVLNIINYEYRLEDVHKALLSNYLSIGYDDFQHENLYNQAHRFRIFGGYIRGGANYWERILESRILSLKKKIGDMGYSANDEDFDIERIKQDMTKIEKALIDFRFLQSMLPVKKNKYTPIEFNKLVKENIIHNFKIKKNIIDTYEDLLKNCSELTESDKIIYREAIEKDARALTAFVQLLDEITFITSERYPGKYFHPAELIDKLKTAVTGQKYQIKEKQNFGVNITSIEQTRGIPYKIMILCGAVDGEFPMNYRPETFLGRELKNSVMKHIQSERLQFYQFLTNDSKQFNQGNKEIYLTYPKNNESEELVRSSFVDALLKVTSLEKDNKVYDLAKLNKAALNNEIENNKSSDNDKFLSQLKDLPWLKIIENENELYSEAGNLLKNLSMNFEEIINQSFKPSYIKSIEYIDLYLKGTMFNNGIVELSTLPEEARQSLMKYKTDPVSITDLETYAKCPFQFFIKKIIKIAEPKEPELALSPLDRGTLLHDILYQFYLGNQAIIFDDNKHEYSIKSILRQAQDERNSKLTDIIPVKLEQKQRNNYLKQLLKLAEKELEFLRFEHPFFKVDEEIITGTNGRPGILEKWLDAELNRIENNWQFKPVLFEFSFGIKSHKQKSTIIEYVNIDGLKIQGKVDRIELFKTSSGYNFMVADYKNSMSRVATNSDIKNGLSFQMPLYMLAVQKILKEYYDIEAKISGGVYYGFEPIYENDKQITHKFSLLPNSNPLCTSEIRKRSGQVLSSKENLDDILNESLNKAKQIVDKISNGIFPVDPVSKACDYCSFSAICRINEKKDIETTENENS